MSTPGVVVGQGIGVPVEFDVVRNSISVTYPSLASVASKGACVKPTATEGEIDLAATGDTLVAGVLLQSSYDPSLLPADVRDNLWGDGLLNFRKIGEPVSVLKNGEVFLTAIHGTPTYGQFLIPYNGGLFQGSATNTLTNGAIVVTKGATTSGGPVVAQVNLA